ncbi:Glycoside Hydrolase [Rhizoctonia solani]|uniref:Glycoside Hydrolase n=1 Tax=Rhizoctonia solani TaxID=456999 RepID=A0A8H7HEX1_9AGAM|nr:Glycoside Hydrolase [Rhizoctonia solani]
MLSSIVKQRHISSASPHTMIPQLSALLLAGALSVVALPTESLSKRADPKAVFAHVIVGNTYNYNIDKWKSDVLLASSKAIDAFTMNVGRDDWQPARVKDAYNATQQVAPNFKLSVSLDMTSLACATVADGRNIINNFITPFKSHPNRYTYNGKMFLSTFAGQSCTFGQGSAPAGWKWLVNNAGTPLYFIPNVQIDDATQLSTTWSFIDGYKLWNAWPRSATDGNQWDDDAWWMSNVKGKGYLTLVSPWFFIHRPGGNPEINNRYLRGDNFEYRQRWQQLISNRGSLPFVEVATWNDYGESHYIGPMSGAWPSDVKYITPNNDHQAWADYTWYYATWWKSGAAPTIGTDRVYMWARPHPKNATVCSSDGVGAVLNANWADDLLYISLFLKSPAQAYCYSGGKNSGTKSLSTGVNEFTVPLSAGGVGCTVTRNGVTIINYKPTDFTYSTSPSVCNMNAWTGLLRG